MQVNKLTRRRASAIFFPINLNLLLTLLPFVPSFFSRARLPFPAAICPLPSPLCLYHRCSRRFLFFLNLSSFLHTFFFSPFSLSLSLSLSFSFSLGYILGPLWPFQNKRKNEKKKKTTATMASCLPFYGTLNLSVRVRRINLHSLVDRINALLTSTRFLSINED